MHDDIYCTRMEPSADHITLLRAITNRTRLRLLGILADGEWSLYELADLLEQSEATIARHLARLSDAGLLREQEGQGHRLYTLNEDRLTRINQELDPAPVVEPDDDLNETQRWERKVLRTFLDGERLVKIPEQRKKRRVILDWLMTHLGDQSQYTEPEINGLLERHHPDVATLRRELVAEGLLRREGNTYYRLDQTG
jgi:biotin operon repressor